MSCRQSDGDLKCNGKEARIRRDGPTRCSKKFVTNSLATLTHTVYCAHALTNRVTTPRVASSDDKAKVDTLLTCREIGDVSDPYLLGARSAACTGPWLEQIRVLVEPMEAIRRFVEGTRCWDEQMRTFCRCKQRVAAQLDVRF